MFYNLRRGTGGQLAALSVGLLSGLPFWRVLPDGFCLCACQESRPEPILGSSQLRGSPYVVAKAQTPFVADVGIWALFFSFPVMFLGLSLFSYKLVIHLFFCSIARCSIVGGLFKFTDSNATGNGILKLCPE